MLDGLPPVESLHGLFLSRVKQFDRILASEHLESTAIHPTPDEWRDQLNKFRAWAADVGLGEKYQGSLEYRLRDEHEVRKESIRLLDILRWSLDYLEVKLEQIAGVEESPDMLQAGRPGEPGFIPAVDRLYNVTRSAIKGMHCTAHFVHWVQFTGIPGYVTDRQDPLRRLNIPRLCEEFPTADNELVERLGATMAKRRALIDYRLRQYKITQHPGTTHRVPDDEALKALERSGRPNPPPEYGPISLSIFWNNAGHPTIPPPPPDAAGEKPFQCPYCGFEIVVQDPTEWAHHIFEDIAPYVCVFPNCPCPERLFNRRPQWSDHLHHRHEELVAVAECPLCRESIQGSEFVKHMAVHQERLGLVVLREMEDCCIGELGGELHHTTLNDSDARKCSPEREGPDVEGQEEKDHTEDLLSP